MPGGRIRRVHDYIKDEKSFCLTYGDGVANVDIAKLIEFHDTHGKLVTLTAAQPPGRLGTLNITAINRVTEYQEKPMEGGNVINGGFFVVSPKALEYIDGDEAP